MTNVTEVRSRLSAGLASKDEARRIAVNIAKLPEFNKAAEIA